MKLYFRQNRSETLAGTPIIAGTLERANASPPRARTSVLVIARLRRSRGNPSPLHRVGPMPSSARWTHYRNTFVGRGHPTPPLVCISDHHRPSECFLSASVSAQLLRTFSPLSAPTQLLGTFSPPSVSNRLPGMSPELFRTYSGIFPGFRKEKARKPLKIKDLRTSWRSRNISTMRG